MHILPSTPTVKNPPEWFTGDVWLDRVVSPQAEVQPQRQDELGGIGATSELEQAEVGRPQVGVVGLEAVEDGTDVAGQQPTMGLDGQLAEVCGVGVGRREGEARRLRLHGGVLAHRLEEPESWAPVR